MATVPPEIEIPTDSTLDHRFNSSFYNEFDTFLYYQSSLSLTVEDSSIVTLHQLSTSLLPREKILITTIRVAGTTLYSSTRIRAYLNLYFNPHTREEEA